MLLWNQPALLNQFLICSVEYGQSASDNFDTVCDYDDSNSLIQT